MYIQKKCIFAQTFEAIHNKDYSVVKTSKTGAFALVFFLPDNISLLYKDPFL